MRDRFSLAGLAICGASVCLTGCGASAPSTAGAHQVIVSITAPTSGASVGVHDIVVAGTVQPATAQVLVSGVPVQVSHGSYARSLRIGQARETITVVATARGFKPATARTTVQYSPRLAAQIATAEAAQLPLPGNFSIPGLETSSGSAGSQPVNVASASTSSSASSTTSSSQQAPGSSGSGSSGGSSPNRGSTPTVTVAQIRSLWLRGCEKGSESGTNPQKFVPYCRCTYNNLYKAGAFSSRQRLLALIKAEEGYERTRDFAKLPAYIRNAIGRCVSKLPPLEPLGGKPVITKLPGQTHGPSSGSSGSGKP